MCTKLGLASTGKLKPDVDALCEATELPFTQIKETVDALSSLCDFATEVVPKLCEDSGVEATGKLGDDVATLVEALPKLRDVALLSTFIMTIFGVLGVQLFQGTLLHRCYEPGALEPIDVSEQVNAHLFPKSYEARRLLRRRWREAPNRSSARQAKPLPR